ncbi:TIGR01777 family protein [Alteromonadaceae bacterium M269]|nr:TIGR01777 family protein [Alteromonadaceae bacterium M269]
MHILITGGTGLIGSHLIPTLIDQHSVSVYTRNVAAATHHVSSRAQLFSSLDKLDNLDQFDAVINLAGESIANKRWTKKQKHRITQSRWSITEKLTQLIKQSSNPPKVFISGSAIGYYGRQAETLITEDYTEVYEEFSHEICKKWEGLAQEAQSEKTRVCLLRTGIVLSRKDGALDKMLPAFKMGMGGPMASGEQYMSWIHISDVLEAIKFLLLSPSASGIYNLTAPNPVTNLEFSQTLASQLKRPCAVKMPQFMLKVLFGEMSDLLIYGQRVIPKRLQEQGFNFKHPDLESALAFIDP